MPGVRPTRRAAGMAAGATVTGRTREHKLVHLAATPDLVGSTVEATIDHAGPYALRGTIATGGTTGAMGLHAASR